MLLRKSPLNLLIYKCLYFNHYQTLNINPTASQEQIKQSFLSLAKKYHPDNNPDDKNNEFIKVKQAYDVLKQPNLRKLYDIQMFPEKIEQQKKNFYFYRTTEFEENHWRRQNQQRRKINFILNSAILIALTGYIVTTVDLSKIIQQQTLHDIRRQNIIMANQRIDDGPLTIQRRKQQYAQEMKDKKIYGNVIQLKVRGAGQQTTKAKEKRLQGISSIQGIQKQKVLILDSNDKNQEFM